MSTIKCLVLSASIVAMATTASAVDEAGLDTKFWELAETTRTLEAVEIFIATFPDSPHVESARALAEELRDDSERRALEEDLFALVGDVRFNEPLQFGSEEIMGRSLAQVLKIAPAFPPVEGLPAAVWQEQTCASCHTWTTSDLCTQAKTYIAKKPAKYQEKPHPFGGSLKINLRNWAQGGCK